jgi:hypothetical protein
MEVSEYIFKYGNQVFISDRTDENILDIHMFQFNEETACHWGGPFDGGFAFGMLINNLLPDASKRIRILPSKKDLQEEKIKKIRKTEYEFPVGKKRTELIKLLDLPYDGPTQEKPFQIYLMGNDDTTYSKFFSNYEDAREEFDLLKFCQPLDMVKDIYPTYLFTN